MTCPNCENNLSEKASFCGKCRTQVKCLSCDNLLGKDDQCCEICGTDVKKKTVTGDAMNSITYDGQTLNAVFTDTVGKDVTETIGKIIVANQERRLGAANSELSEDAETVIEKAAEKTEDVTAEDVTSEKVNDAINLIEKDGVNSLFRENEGRFDLMETNLNATGKIDYAIRLTYLTILYFDKSNKTPINKTVINKLLEYCGVYDSNYRNKFSKMKSDFLVNSGTIEFRPAGKLRAEQYLKDVFTPRDGDKWDLSQLKSGGASKSSKGSSSSTTKTSTSSSAAKSVVQEKFDAHHKTKSLKDLFDEKVPGKNTNKVILTIAYYLHEIIGQDSISDGNIDFGYRSMGLPKRPKHLRQTIINMKNSNAWFEDAEDGRWKLSRNGEIYVENGFSS